MTCLAAFTITAAPVTTTTRTATPDDNNHDQLSSTTTRLRQHYKTARPASCDGINPSSADQGATLDVTITGLNTNFVAGLTIALFSGTGITVNSTQVISAAVAVATITIASDAPLGACDVTVTTG